MTVTPRRWQRGERAICSCPEWPAPAYVVVVSGGKSGPPTVERDGAVHVCEAAVLDAGRAGRPRTALPAVDSGLVQQLRIAAERRGETERALVERALTRELEESSGQVIAQRFSRK